MPTNWFKLVTGLIS